MTSRFGFIGVSCTRFHSSPLSKPYDLSCFGCRNLRPRSTRYVNSFPPICSNCPNYSRANACIHSPFALGPNPFLGMEAYHGLGLRSHPLQFANASLFLWEIRSEHGKTNWRSLDSWSLQLCSDVSDHFSSLYTRKPGCLSSPDFALEVAEPHSASVYSGKGLCLKIVCVASSIGVASL